ncbi:hypothetical protein OEZ85_014241 [Tetradesmus obliquus]|uniref:Peroxin-12 n=1 Tax=Tetradesmus obliquus TaxID=3088 RepID=A0ABY8U7D8_TETOB|nr:hypothetical protein OEZ85_014241 [Tetradesmus obliquus]
MAFMHLGGDAGAKPTYFEVYAADKLVPTLKAAVIYSLSVLGQSRSWVLRLLSYEDEVFALVSLLLERHSLSTMHATFAESLYGLKRQPAPPKVQPAAAGSAAAAAGSGASSALGLLSRKQQYQALLCEVLLPYLKSKADHLYARHAQQQGGVLGLALARSTQQQQQQASSSSSSGRARLARIAAAARHYGLAALLKLYPYAHAAIEGVKFYYQLCYLLDVLDCHSPTLHLLGQRLVRLTGPEMAQMEREKQQQRQQQLARAAQQPSRVAAAARKWWLLGSAAAADHLRTVLILSVFGFKILEWWYSSAEDRLSSAAALPPPPPPPAPKPHPAGVGLPADVARCPLCRQRRVNPAMLAVSGYAFCYPCLFNHVSEAHCCPVTRIPATLEHIRKLYEAM